jgi:tight adherence protein C
MMMIAVLAFVFGLVVVAGAALVLAPAGPTAIEQRLGEVTGAGAAPKEADLEYQRAVVAALKRIGSVAPKSSSETGKLRRLLVAAGYRGGDAVVVFFGIRLGLALIGFVLLAFPLIMRPNFMTALAACALGYLLPSMALKRMVKRRQHRIRLGLADALDLMVVSVEAGLGLDQAIMRVSDELAHAHPDLADELRLINLELRAGKARAEALHNLAERTGVDDISSLVAMLVQTDKFGTSVAQSLRVHSDTLRTKRRQRAEEAAAKTGVKMVFPLVFCIFPAIWVVTIGPAAIKFVQVLGPMVKK